MFCIIALKPVLSRFNCTGCCSKYTTKITVILLLLSQSEFSKTAPQKKEGRGRHTGNFTESRIRASELRVVAERINSGDKCKFAHQVCSEEHSHRGPVTPKCRRKAHEPYSDQPVKHPADMTVGSYNNWELMAGRTNRLPRGPGGLRRWEDQMLRTLDLGQNCRSSAYLLGVTWCKFVDLSLSFVILEMVIMITVSLS